MRTPWYYDPRVQILRRDDGSNRGVLLEHDAEAFLAGSQGLLGRFQARHLLLEAGGVRQGLPQP